MIAGISPEGFEKENDQMDLESPRPSFQNRPLCTAVLLTVLFAAAAAYAQSPKVTVNLDPAASEIRWKLTGNAHDTHGIFRLKGGQVTFDPATGEAQGELLVDLASGESGNSSRDSRMQSDVLESAKYPQASFHPTKITGTVKAEASQTVTAEGTFTIHGADHPLKLEILVKVDGDRATATTHFSVPYVAWGMKDPSTFLLRVGKDVNIDVVAQGTVEGLPAK
jgi:polyisoprenoid-binding protein YceI